MFGIQANLDVINKLSWHIIKHNKLWPQEIPGNHMQCNKTNVEIQNTVPGMPVEATYRHYPL